TRMSAPPAGGRITNPSYYAQPRRAWIGGALLVLFALPGLWPALAMLGEEDESLRRKAGFIQVGHRLSHHLDPMDFPPWSWAGYAALTAVWIAGWRRGVFSGERRFFAWFTGAALLFALAGLAIGLRSEPLARTPFAELSQFDFLRVRLLRFYPFRLYDLLAPLAAAVVVVALVEWAWRRLAAGNGAHRASRFLPTIGCGLLFAIALGLPAVDRNPSRYSAERMADWLEMCRWIEAKTPRDALFVTPDTPAASWAFHWHAQRAEYVSYKNCPQDARGILDWNERFGVLHDWATSHYRDRRYDADDLRALAAKTGASFLLTERFGPMTVEPLHANDTYRLYRLNDALATDRAP
ncbi:MAG: DUF6798 domain-containing protein, partial [Planctomycetaceae bacterium]